MMLSVWNQAAGVYDYYEDGREQASLNAPSPDHIPHRTLGATVDQAGWPLPANARKVGTGAVAIGRIASRGGGRALGAIDLGSPTVRAVALVGIAALLYKFVVKGRR